MGPLPEKEVYAVDWQLDFGSVMGELSPAFLASIKAIIVPFAFHYNDFDNLLTPIIEPPDITCAHVAVQDIKVSIWGKSSVTTIELDDGFRLHFDNVASERYTHRIVTEVPSILIRSLAIADSHDGKLWTVWYSQSIPISLFLRVISNFSFSPFLQHSLSNRIKVSDEKMWVEILNIDTGLNAFIFKKSPDWEQMRYAQQVYVQTQDKSTRRCDYLWDPNIVPRDSTSTGNMDDFDPANDSLEQDRIVLVEGTELLDHAPKFLPPFERA
jgi:hypothetical protein